MELKSDQEIIEEQNFRIKELEKQILNNYHNNRTKDNIVYDIRKLIGSKGEEIGFHKLCWNDLVVLERRLQSSLNIESKNHDKESKND